MRPAHVFVPVLFLALAACDNSGDFESNCNFTCTLTDGGVMQTQQRVACCGKHDNPSHPNEEGSACTVDWVLSHSQQFCETRTFVSYEYQPDAGVVSPVYSVCASAVQCNCDAPHTYASWNGCD